jgi:ActR/RegA family two-component response regulator
MNKDGWPAFSGQRRFAMFKNNRSMPADTVLIVEDDVFISMDAADSVSRVGVNVVTAETVSDALDILETEEISVAILDFQVRDGAVTPVVDRLRQRGIPFRIVSGSPLAEIADKGIPAGLCAQKPADYVKILISLISERPWTALRPSH